MNEMKLLKNKIAELNNVIEGKERLLNKKDKEINQYNITINEFVEKQFGQSKLIDSYKQQIIQSKKVLNELVNSKEEILDNLNSSYKNITDFIENSRKRISKMICISTILTPILEENIHTEAQKTDKSNAKISVLENELERVNKELKDQKKLSKGTESLQMELKKVQEELETQMISYKKLEEKYFDDITNNQEEASYNETELKGLIEDLKEENDQLKERLGNDENMLKNLLNEKNKFQIVLKTMNDKMNEFVNIIHKKLNEYRHLPVTISQLINKCINQNYKDLQSITDSYSMKLETAANEYEEEKKSNDKLILEILKLKDQLKKYKQEEEKNPKYVLKKLSRSVSRNDVNSLESDNDSVNLESSSAKSSNGSNSSIPREVTPEMVSNVEAHLLKLIMKCLSLIPQQYSIFI